MIIASHLVDLHQREEFLVLYNKRGCNGKSTLNTLEEATFGNFFYSCKREMITEAKTMGGEGASPILHGMKGKRLVSYQELKRDDRLCSATIKKLTGGDTINSRALYKEPEEFKINALQIASTNQLPAFDCVDGAVIRRCRMIEFENLRFHTTAK